MYKIRIHGNNNRLQKETENNIEKYKQQQSDIYGFCADPDQPSWKNIESYILQMPPYLYKSKIANMSCHNYCEPKSTMPSGIKSLLGMGLKYCIKVPRPTNKLSKTFDRFREDVRRIAFFKKHPPEDESSYIAKLYIKSH